jgi:hypothetical protein
VLKHDIMADALPTGFDLVHARWLVEWLPDKRLALERMADSLDLGERLLGIGDVMEEPSAKTSCRSCRLRKEGRSRPRVAR